MKNKFLIANIALIALVMIGDVLYIITDTLLAKSLTSIGFVLLGALNLLQLVLNKEKDLKFPIIMLVGLFFAMLGDIILEIHFISGAALFAIGHIFYFVAYTFVLKFKWKDLIYGVAIFVPSVLFITLAPIFDFKGVLMEIVCVVYAIIISCMVGKSISNLVKEKSVRTILIVVGSCLFFFSDLMLLLNVFANLGKVVSVLCLATYYPAECILAYSISVKSETQIVKKEEVNAND